jgi:hypothetical protein
MRLISLCLVALAAGSGCNQQAEPLQVQGAALTSGTLLLQGRRAQTSHFGPDDMIWMFVYVTWPDVLRSAGPHGLVFNWYCNGKLVSRTDYTKAHGRPFLFAHTPSTLETHRAAAALGPGSCRVETLVDGALFASRDFDIAQ